MNDVEMFESMRNNQASNKSNREVPQDYATEIQALQQCCQHRTHCLVHDIMGFVKVRMHIYIYICEE